MGNKFSLVNHGTSSLYENQNQSDYRPGLQISLSDADRQSEYFCYDCMRMDQYVTYTYE